MAGFLLSRTTQCSGLVAPISREGYEVQVVEDGVRSATVRYLAADLVVPDLLLRIDGCRKFVDRFGRSPHHVDRSSDDLTGFSV